MHSGMNSMNIDAFSFLKIILFILALSADLLTAGIAYGAGGIRIASGAAVLIGGLGSLILGISLFLGRTLGGWLPENLLSLGGSLCLVLLGIYKLMDFRIRCWRKAQSVPQKDIAFSFAGLRIILNIYGNPIEADEDGSRTLSMGEASVLTLAMSLDSFAAGVGYAWERISVWGVMAAFFFMSMFSLRLGYFFGSRIAKERDVSWLGGVLLIFLGVLGF